jgi:hypothetical protein
MSQLTAPTDSHTGSPSDEPLFQRAELTQFADDDREAGMAIGKMLSVLFIYTVIVMAISAYATYAYWMGR